MFTNHDLQHIASGVKGGMLLEQVVHCMQNAQVSFKARPGLRLNTPNPSIQEMETVIRNSTKDILGELKSIFEGGRSSRLNREQVEILAKALIHKYRMAEPPQDAGLGGMGGPQAADPVVDETLARYEGDLVETETKLVEKKKKHNTAAEKEARLDRAHKHQQDKVEALKKTLQDAEVEAGEARTGFLLAQQATIEALREVNMAEKEYNDTTELIRDHKRRRLAQ